MTLEKYLIKHGLTSVAFAEKVGVDQSTIHRLRKRDQIPSRDLMDRIFKATGGAVRADDFFGLPKGATKQ